MYRVLPLALVALVGCGKMTESEFLDEYNELYCAQLELCTEGANLCSETWEDWECTSAYDNEHAKDCITGEWTCDDTMGVSLPAAPSACTKACFGEPTPTDTGTAGTTGAE